MTRIATSIAVLLLVATPAAAGALHVESKDFKDGAALPTAHIYPRCGGENISPDIHWSGVPDAARSLVVTMIDVSVKDPKGWTHWIVVDLAPSTTELPRGLAELPVGAKAVQSNFGDLKYAGPCPPPGTGTHRYEFTVWAMPAPVTAIPANMPAADVPVLLSKTAQAHATIAGLVTAK